MQAEKTIEQVQAANSELIEFARGLLYEVSALEHEVRQLRLHNQMIHNKYKLVTRLDASFNNCN